MCAADRGPLQDISFPPQSELRVNGGEVKANLRGLKNKPGSTRPADITSALRFKPSHYLNNVDFTYALTNKVSFPHNDHEELHMRLMSGFRVCFRHELTKNPYRNTTLPPTSARSLLSRLWPPPS